MASDKVKVLLAISSLHRGGAERQIVELIRHMDRDRYDPWLALCDTTDEYGVDLAPERVVDLRSPAGSTLVTFGRLVRLLSTVRPDVTHTWGGLLNLYGRMAVRVTGIGKHLSAVRAGIPYPRDLRNERLTWRWTDAIVANSVGTCGVLVKAGVPAQLITVIENGVDAERFTPAGGDLRARLREEFGMNGLVVVLPARLSEEKNQLAAVDAMALMRSEGRLPEGLSLWLVGRVDEGPLARELRAKVARVADVVKVCGVTSDMPDYLAAADAALLPSRFEGMPNVVLEAMACGTPCLVSPAANRDTLVRNGVEGYELAGDAPKQIADGMARFAALPEAERRMMGSLGRRRVTSDFTLERMARRTCDLYERLIASRGPRGLLQGAEG